jgi:Tfp pilus assembly protein PilZ
VLANLAAGGLRFACDRMIGEGDSLELRLTLPTRGEPYYLKGVVMWVTPLTVGADCGVAFTDTSPDAQFELNELVEFLNAHNLRPRPPRNGG